MVARLAPESGDIVIRQEEREEALVYVLHTASGVDQYLLRTREDAILQAIAYAKHQHVRAWFAKGDKDFVLLGTFQEKEVGPTRAFIMAKSKKTNDVTTTAADRASKSRAYPATVTNSDVARRAYDLYLARGFKHGHDLEDWLQAERELHSDPEC